MLPMGGRGGFRPPSSGGGYGGPGVGMGMGSHPGGGRGQPPPPQGMRPNYPVRARPRHMEQWVSTTLGLVRQPVVYGGAMGDSALKGSTCTRRYRAVGA
jgi:hypothetical protein